MASAPTYTPIATYTVSSATPTISFTSIPSTYTDLVLIIGSALSATSSKGGLFTLNSDTGTNYSRTELYGTGSSAGSSRGTNISSSATYIGAITGFDTTNPANAILHFMNYSNTATYKTVLGRFTLATQESDATVYLWRSTSAINRIDLNLQSSVNWTAGTFTLYGIVAA